MNTPPTTPATEPATDPTPTPPADQTTDRAAAPVCKFDEGCHRVVPCDPGCGAPTLRNRVAAAVDEGFRLHAELEDANLGDSITDSVLAVLPELAEVERLRTKNARMRHELEVMYSGAFDSLPSTQPADRAAILSEAVDVLVAEIQAAGRSATDDARLPGLSAAVEKLRRLAAEAQQQPDTEMPKADCNVGPGWYEVINPRNATTCIALVYGDGSLYLPEGDALTPEEFAFAAARGNAHRLVRVDEVAPAVEAQPTAKPEAQPESCAHCGKTIRRITGTLTEWWVHDPGGQAFCYPWQPASSPRATPQPAAGARQDGAQPQARVVQCSRAVLNHSHDAHDWEPQPGMEPVHCPGHRFTKEV